MSQKMTDADRSHMRGVAISQWRSTTRGGEATVIACADAVADEAQQWLSEKDAAIKALADALEATLRVDHLLGGIAFDVRAALRLVGRLP